MFIRREDFGKIEDLSKGSHKKIWFTCDICGIGVLQAYRNYLKQNNGYFCRDCRNKHTANRKDVRQKHSINGKNRWKQEDYRKKISTKLSTACKKAWDNNDDRKKRLSENNPMYRKETIELVSKNSSVSIEELEELAKKYNWDFIERRRFKRGGTQLILKCKKCGYISNKRLDVFRRNITGCKYCQGKTITSKSEYEIFKFIKTIYKETILKNNRKLLYPLELDIVIPDKKIAIEYCGIYWHSEEQGKNKDYHLYKLEKCNKAGYRLITIFEDEWINKKDIVKNRIKNILECNFDRIYARNCSIKEIESKEANIFIKQYHLQGVTGSILKLGAFHKDELVAVMTFSRPSIAKGRKNNYSREIFEIARFCSSRPVIGIASKLFKYFQRTYEWDEIYSYADRRWGDGLLYEKLGMRFIKHTKPNYWYFKGIKRYHRFQFRKSVLSSKLDIFDSNKTEYQNMIDNGWNRIWDCGNSLFRIER